MKLRKKRKQSVRLEGRIRAYENTPRTGGIIKPGSQNPHKGGGLTRRR